MKIISRTYYYADDGRRFENEAECQEYEKKLKDKALVTTMIKDWYNQHLKWFDTETASGRNLEDWEMVFPIVVLSLMILTLH